MTWLKSISSVFFATAVLVLAIWLLLETCNKKKAPSAEKINTSIEFLNEQTRLRDSASKATAAKDQMHKADSAKWKRVVDSTTTQLSITKNKLTAAQAVVRDLATGVQDAYSRNDTSGFVTSCLKLSDSVKTLNAQIDRYKYQADTLLKAKDSLQAVTQKRLDEKDNLLRLLRQSERNSDSTIASLKNDIKKATNKANKKYAIGIGGSAGITTMGTPGGSVGLTISRTIIRF